MIYQEIPNSSLEIFLNGGKRSKIFVSREIISPKMCGKSEKFEKEIFNFYSDKGLFSVTVPSKSMILKALPVVSRHQKGISSGDRTVRPETSLNDSALWTSFEASWEIHKNADYSTTTWHSPYMFLLKSKNEELFTRTDTL